MENDCPACDLVTWINWDDREIRINFFREQRCRELEADFLRFVHQRGKNNVFLDILDGSLLDLYLVKSKNALQYLVFVQWLQYIEAVQRITFAKKEYLLRNTSYSAINKMVS